MFRNRELRIRVKKLAEGEDETEVRNEAKVWEDKVTLVTSVIKDMAKSVFIGVCAYVVLDTGRQVLVARNTNT